MIARSLLLSSLAAAVLATPAVSQHTGVKAEVLAATKAFLSVLETRDADVARALITDDTRLTLLRPAQDGMGGGSRVMVMTGEQFIAAVTRPGPDVKELMRNPRVEVDGDLATVWTEYQVLVDGAVHHCGHDAFQLVRQGGGGKGGRGKCLT